MKVLKRLNAVTAAEKMDFDTFFGIMKKHTNDATEIVNKALAPVFNKLPVPLYKANDSYERVAFNLASDIVKQSYKNTVYFTVDTKGDVSCSITIDDKFKVQCDLHISTNFMDFGEVKQFADFTKALASISQKDFDSAIKKARAEMEKALDKWSKE